MISQTLSYYSWAWASIMKHRMGGKVLGDLDVSKIESKLGFTKCVNNKVNITHLVLDRLTFGYTCDQVILGPFTLNKLHFDFM